MTVSPWMKAAGWLILGGGLGFFGGVQVGTRMAAKGSKNGKEESFLESDAPSIYAFNKALDIYNGDESEQDEILADPHLEEKLNKSIADNDTVPMDIPQLHPEDMTPVPIDETEWNNNEDDYERVILEYYEYDEVVYDGAKEDILVNPESLLGIGFFVGFYGDPNNPTETLYIRNDTMGTLYRVDLIHAAYHDEAPEEEPGEEEVDYDDGYYDEEGME